MASRRCSEIFLLCSRISRSSRKDRGSSSTVRNDTIHCFRSCLQYVWFFSRSLPTYSLSCRTFWISSARNKSFRSMNTKLYWTCSVASIRRTRRMPLRTPQTRTTVCTSSNYTGSSWRIRRILRINDHYAIHYRIFFWNYLLRMLSSYPVSHQPYCCSAAFACVQVTIQSPLALRPRSGCLSIVSLARARWVTE